jgi:predicted metal-binding protein
MIPRKDLESVFQRHACTDFRWIDPRLIIVAEWVRMKCLFGCPHYGKGAVCPPNTPPVDQCERFFREYRDAVLFHFAGTVSKPEARHAWTHAIDERLLDIEREIFLAGYRKAFLLFCSSCRLCPECAPARADCHSPLRSRPAPEGMAVDVFATVRQYGLPIEVLPDYDREMNRYAFLLIE